MVLHQAFRARHAQKTDIGGEARHLLTETGCNSLLCRRGALPTGALSYDTRGARGGRGLTIIMITIMITIMIIIMIIIMCTAFDGPPSPGRPPEAPGPPAPRALYDILSVNKSLIIYIYIYIYTYTYTYVCIHIYIYIYLLLLLLIVLLVLYCYYHYY